MTPRSRFRHNFNALGRLFVVGGSLLFVTLFAAAQQQSIEKPPQLPAPYETIKDKKQFKAVQLGTGNTFSIAQTPPDFQLYSFAISTDGNQFALGWASGRIEIWGRRDYGISADGPWLAISQFGSVDLWRTKDILRDCVETR